MKYFQFSVRQLVVMLSVMAILVAVWQWTLQPSHSDRLAQVLRTSVEKRNVDSAKRAIQLGADVDPVSFSLLDIAVMNRDRPMIDMLLTEGAIPQRALEEVLRSGDAKLLDDFMERGAAPKWSDVKTLIAEGDLEALRLLIPRIAKITGHDNSNPNTGWDLFLDYAITAPEHCRHALIEDLLKDRSQSSLNALEYADWIQQVDVIEQFRAHGFRYGLPEMVALGRIEEVQSLLKSKPDIVRDQPYLGPWNIGSSGTLALSLKHGHHQISMLLLAAGATTEGPSQFRDLLIVFAASKPNLDVLKQVLDRSADWYDPSNVVNGSPIDYLLRSCVGEPESVRLLLDAGVPLNEKFGTELILAIDGLGRCNPKEYPRQIEVVRILHQAGASQQASSSEMQSIDDYCRKKYGFQNLDELMHNQSLPR